MFARTRAPYAPHALSRTVARAFTLVELLVVIGIIALLIGILLPVISRAQQASRATKCMSNLRTIGQALLNYSSDNKGFVVPAYNLPLPPGSPPNSPNYTGGPDQPLEGWACILDRDGYMRSSAQSESTAFYCPDTFDVPGLETGATGAQVNANRANPRGWVEWPMKFNGPGDTSPKQAVTIPDRGFNKIIRVSYWINAYHPTGQTLTATQIAQKDLYYSTVVGYGPDLAQSIRAKKSSHIRHSSLTITVADGVFMGRQSVNLLGMTNNTIGYRHRGPGGPNTAANVAFADGHVETLPGDHFPCAYATSASYASNNGATTLAEQQQWNFGGPTVYPSPEGAYQTFLQATPGAN
jgi:prepilin-type processing-associated H-X9-DG protein/prepilin-type N-terminal cleavage/methylation domain-containing protein